MKTSTDRWTEPEQYLSNWDTRSQKLLDLFDETVPNAANLGFTEYGCGPNAPFSQAVGSNRTCLRYDIKAWDDTCTVVNLNDPEFHVERSDVAVMCGVGEYMSDLRQTLTRLGTFHDYLLISYHPYRFRKRVWDIDAVEELNKRATSGGWRNHYTLPDLLRVFDGVAFPVRSERMGAQVLNVLEFCR